MIKARDFVEQLSQAVMRKMEKQDIDLPLTVDRLRYCLLLTALRQSDYNITQAAAILGLKRTTITMMLKKYKSMTEI
jgi:transcriptional regulator with GAF, ATPase, and Fis domain